MCFCYRRLAHKQEKCGFHVRPMEKTKEEGSSERQRVQQTKRADHTEQSEQSDPNFGDWMIVTKRKSFVRLRRNCGTKLPHQQPSSVPKESKGKEVKSNSLTPPNFELTFQFKSSHVVRAVGDSENSEATLTSHKIGEMHTQDLHGDCRKEIQMACQNPFSYDLDTPSSQTTNLRNKKAKLSKAGRDKKNPSTSSSKALKRSNPEPDTCFKPSALVSCPSSHGFSLPFLPSTVPLPTVGWAIWHKNKIIAIPEELIAQIRAASIDTLGWFDKDLVVA